MYLTTRALCFTLAGGVIVGIASFVLAVVLRAKYNYSEESVLWLMILIPVAYSFLSLITVSVVGHINNRRS